MRGNHQQGHDGRHQAGSIPACAGEPAPANRRPSRSRVYPRVCGGTYPLRPLRHCGAGLSPRVRGNPLRVRRTGRGTGSIPACAGEPVRAGGTPGGSRVYPRVCGGTERTRGRSSLRAGLSPRVRGNHAGHDIDAGHDRSIPACAGEPSIPPVPARPSAVYPRVCGGTRLTDLRARLDAGLSPRVRGNLSGPPNPISTPRSIPACAGEPAYAGIQKAQSPVYPRVCGGTAFCPC